MCVVRSPLCTTACRLLLPARLPAAGGFKQVEAKYPALLFKQQLDAFVQKIFPMIRDNVRKEISPMLANCIHTPKTGGRTAARPGAATPAAAGAH